MSGLNNNGLQNGFQAVNNAANQMATSGGKKRFLKTRKLNLFTRNKTKYNK